MFICDLLKGVISSQKKIDVYKLPSQGLFYKNNFEIKIKKASLDDINEYEKNFVKDNLGLIIQKVKCVVEKNIILPNGYIFEDIKSIDVVFLFLEIVKFTNGKPIKIFYSGLKSPNVIEFDEKSFNYYKIPTEVMDKYDPIERKFNLNGYSFTLPSIGVENCLTLFLMNKSKITDTIKYKNLTYDFTYFVDDKNFLTFEEIENLIQIFNFDIEKEESDKIKQILKLFLPLQRYSLIKDGKEIDINSKIDLENIWK